MRPKTLLALALIVAAFAAYIAFVERRLPSTDERRDTEKRVLDLMADDVTAISIEHGDETLRLERSKASTGGTDGAATPPAKEPAWSLARPFEARADRLMANDLINALVSLKKERTLEDTARTDAGLNAPRAVVTLETTDGRTRIAFGPEVPGTTSLLIGLGDDEIFQVPGTIMSTLRRPASDWRDKTLFHARREDVERVVLEGPTGRTVLVRHGEAIRDATFNLESPIADRADAEDMRNLLTQLSGLMAERFLDDEKPAGGDAAKGMGAGRIEVTLTGSEAPFIVELGPALPDDGALRQARVDGRLVATRSQIGDLLTVAPDGWRDPRWTTLQVFAIEQARFADTAGITTLIREDAEWQRDGETVDFGAASDLLYAVIEVTSDSFGAQHDLHFASQDDLLDVTLRTEDEIAERLHLRRLADGQLAAVAEGRDSALILEADAAEPLLRRLATLRDAVPTSSDGDAPG